MHCLTSIELGTHGDLHWLWKFFVRSHRQPVTTFNFSKSNRILLRTLIALSASRRHDIHDVYQAYVIEEGMVRVSICDTDVYSVLGIFSTTVLVQSRTTANQRSMPAIFQFPARCGGPQSKLISVGLTEPKE